MSIVRAVLRFIVLTVMVLFLIILMLINGDARLEPGNPQND